MRNWLILIMVIIISAVLAFVLGDFIHANIILPIANLLNIVIWVVQSFIESIDQGIFWISFLIIALLIAGASLFTSVKIQIHSEISAPIHKSRITIWQERIDNLHRGDYFKWRLAKNLGGLALEVIAFRHGIPVVEALIKMKENHIDVPDEIREYIIAGQQSSSLKNDGLSIRGNNFQYTTMPLELTPQVMLEFLDTQLANDIEPVEPI